MCVCVCGSINKLILSGDGARTSGYIKIRVHLCHTAFGIWLYYSHGGDKQPWTSLGTRKASNYQAPQFQFGTINLTPVMLKMFFVLVIFLPLS